ncbi:dihydroneopterin aldolase [Cereibacter sp. SYSU M97828]|nr:dihydroneopterin aldolase [Cereibacter flavus]
MPPIPDRIFLHDHVVEVEIGAFQLERGVLQRIRFNVDVDIAPPAGPLDDDVDRILSYDRIHEAIGAELAAGRLNLLETLAENVARRILAAPQALAVSVRIEKLDRGPFVLGVEIRRSREQVAPLESDPVRPRIVMAGAEVQPGTIICPVATATLRSDAPESQRRIDLLALDQAAWALAGAGITVAATRTEIDWAMRRGGIVAWAPSRMVLDAVHGPAATDPKALAQWLATELDADHGVISSQAGSRVPPSSA